MGCLVYILVVSIVLIGAFGGLMASGQVWLAVAFGVIGAILLVSSLAGMAQRRDQGSRGPRVSSPRTDVLLANRSRSPHVSPPTSPPRRTADDSERTGPTMPKPVFHDFSTKEADWDREDITGLSDAYTGESLDAHRGIYQCESCKACYHADTVEFLRKEHLGRCLVCKGNNLSQRTKTDTLLPTKNFAPQVVTLHDYRYHIGRVVTFQGYVVRILESKGGGSFAIMFEDTTWTKGLKIFVPSQSADNIGGREFANSLLNCTITVRGLLEDSRLFGPQIIVTKKSMIHRGVRA